MQAPYTDFEMGDIQLATKYDDLLMKHNLAEARLEKLSNLLTETQQVTIERLQRQLHEAEQLTKIQDNVCTICGSLYLYTLQDTRQDRCCGRACESCRHAICHHLQAGTLDEYQRMGIFYCRRCKTKDLSADGDDEHVCQNGTHRVLKLSIITESPLVFNMGVVRPDSQELRDARRQAHENEKKRMIEDADAKIVKERKKKQKAEATRERNQLKKEEERRESEELRRRVARTENENAVLRAEQRLNGTVSI